MVAEPNFPPIIIQELSIFGCKENSIGPAWSPHLFRSIVNITVWIVLEGGHKVYVTFAETLKHFTFLHVFPQLVLVSQKLNLFMTREPNSFLVT